MQMVLIGIAGRKGVGKDTAADFLVSTFGYHKRAFADPIKETITRLFRLSPSQLEGDNKEVIDPRHGLSPRQMMQRFGTDMFRNMIKDSFWVDYFVEWYREHHDSDVVVPDVRFQNEVDAIQNLGGMVILVKRTSSESLDRHTLCDKHESETGVNHLEGIDYIIQNDGSVEEFLSCIESFTELHNITVRVRGFLKASNHS